MAAPSTFCHECGASNPQQATHCFACNSVLSPSLSLQTVPANGSIPPVRAGGPLVPSYLLHSRYSIVDQIGTGGFGAVYKARDTLFSSRLVAIKEMNQDGLQGDELASAAAAFEREALLLTGLTHPNLPRVHDYFNEHGRSYVVMDFIAGDTLEDYLDKVVQRLSIETVLDIGIQLCSVLDYLHNHQPPIVFRDLKPANIMRTADNHIYLIDFGIARHFKPGQTKDTIPLGSKGYAAPEQYGKAQTTPQSDIYGLGATLHELLTGDDPSLSLFHFKPLSTDILNKREFPNLPEKEKSSIVSQLNAHFRQMVEMDISKRPANAAVVKEELQHLLAQCRVPAAKRVKRRGFVGGCLGVLASCGVGIALGIFAIQDPNAVDLMFAHPFTGTTPVLSRPVPEPESELTLNKPLYTYRGHVGAVEAAVWSPHRQYIASAGTLDGSVQVWDPVTGDVVFISDSVPQGPARFATDNQRVDALAWFPDSRRIAAALGNDTVSVWSLETGKENVFQFSQTGKTNVLTLSPDGSRLAAVSGNITIQVCSATTGELIYTYTGHTQAVLTLAWSPDGKSIVSGAADGVVRVWNVSTGSTSVIVTAQRGLRKRGRSAKVEVWKKQASTSSAPEKN